MKTKTLTQAIQEFFNKNTERYQFFKILDIVDESEKTGRFDKNSISFEEARKAAAIKLFGEGVVNSKTYKLEWLKNERRVLLYCIERDEQNYNSQPKLQQKRSSLPKLIEEWTKSLVQVNQQIHDLIINK